MADDKQNNIFKSSVQLQETLSSRSVPHVSGVTKIKRRHHSFKQHINSDLSSIRPTSSIHVTIRISKKNEQQINKSRVGSENNLDSIGTFYNQQLSSVILQRQNILRSSIQSSSNKIKQTPSYRSMTQSQLHKRNKDVSNKNIPSTQHSSHHQQAWTKNYPSHSDVTTGFKNEHPTILDETKKTKKRKYFNKDFPCSCSLGYILLSLLIGLLLIGAIVGIFVAVFMVSTNTTTSSTTLTTTTVISSTCNCLCADESWTFDSDRLARWPFEGTLADVMDIYNATSINNPSFNTNGYVNQALLFDASFNQSLSTPYIPLASTSFTIEVWLKPTLFPNLVDHSIFGLCPSATSYQCLYLVIRTISAKQYLYFGFYNADCPGNTTLTLNQWIHAAFVFDMASLTQSIYLNGILDNSCTVSSPIMAATGSGTIGTVSALIPIINMNFYQGYMDQLTITARAKSSCEIREDATLVACFLFNAAAPYTDFGPNSLFSSELSTSIVSSGYSYDAIAFNNISYFQASDFTAVGLASEAFSIILWVRPRSVLGPIVHVSQLSNGKGWCLPFLGITANGSVVAQIYNGAVVTIWGPSIPMSPIWSHLVQTWSPTNGLRLYINNVLVASQTSALIFSADGASNYITLANSLNGYGFCFGGGLGATSPQQLNCDIDDFRVYSRELTASDVSTIYYND